MEGGFPRDVKFTESWPLSHLSRHVRVAYLECQLPNRGLHKSHTLDWIDTSLVTRRFPEFPFGGLTGAVRPSLVPLVEHSQTLTCGPATSRGGGGDGCGSGSK